MKHAGELARPWDLSSARAAKESRNTVRNQTGFVSEGLIRTYFVQNDVP
jgi:hypothetical protein